VNSIRRDPRASSVRPSAAIAVLARVSVSGFECLVVSAASAAWPHYLDPLVGIQRAHVGLYIRSLGDAGLMASSANTVMHGVRGLFRFAHIDGLIPADPAVYARLPKVHSDESRTQGPDRLEPIRFLQSPTP
jgi:integrase/recombinase XerD